MRFVEILLCIFLFPLMLILGIVYGIIHMYSTFDKAFWTTINRKDLL